MNYLEAPEEHKGDEDLLFIAGGISNCSDWQRYFISLIEWRDIIIANPRRYNFDIEDKNMEEAQIEWEHRYLTKAKYLSFWFPKETVCPITLFELGKFSQDTSKELFIGIDPNYTRKRDVEIQMWLIRSDINIVYSIEDLAEQVNSTIWKVLT